jgi:hypothetical protein
MMRSRAVFAASAVFLSAALAASFLLLHKPALEASEVLTWDCEFPVHKPKTIMIYCGDGGAYIAKITWTSWGQDGATGTGEYYKNICEPDCADGKILHARVHVSLSDLTQRNGKFYLRTLDMESTTRKDFPWGESGHFEWDVMEFVQQMNRVQE